MGAMLARSSPAVRNHYNVVRPPVAISVRKGVHSATTSPTASTRPTFEMPRCVSTSIRTNNCCARSTFENRKKARFAGSVSLGTVILQQPILGVCCGAFVSNCKGFSDACMTTGSPWHRQQASEKQQGTKSRALATRRCSNGYGELGASRLAGNEAKRRCTG